MNCFKAYPEKTYAGWRVMMRFAHNGMSRPVLDKGGKIKLFKTELEATAECLRHLLDYMNGDYQSWDNPNTSAPHRLEAERLFQKEQPVEQGKA